MAARKALHICLGWLWEADETAPDEAPPAVAIDFDPTDYGRYDYYALEAALVRRRPTIITYTISTWTGPPPAIAGNRLTDDELVAMLE